MRVSLFFVALAALAAVGAARDLADGSAAGRELLQTAADCARSITNCQACEWPTVASGLPALQHRVASEVLAWLHALLCCSALPACLPAPPAANDSSPTRH